MEKDGEKNNRSKFDYQVTKKSRSKDFLIGVKFCHDILLTLYYINMTQHEETTTTIHEHVSSDHPSHHVHQKSSKQLTTPMAIIIGAVIIAVGILGYGFLTSGTTGTAKASTKFTGKDIGADEPILGVNKKVFVVEYSDTECPFCVQFNPTIEQIRNEYKDKIGFVYRYYPLPFHPHAQKEAEAIACANKLAGSKGFFEYMTAMFDYKTKNQTTQLKPTGIKDLATEVGIDAKALTECVESGEMASIVTDSLEDGKNADVTGTPTTFVIVKDWKGGYQVVASIVGAQTYDYVKKAVEQGLSK